MLENLQINKAFYDCRTDVTQTAEKLFSLSNVSRLLLSFPFSDHAQI